MMRVMPDMRSLRRAALLAAAALSLVGAAVGCGHQYEYHVILPVGTTGDSIAAAASEAGGATEANEGRTTAPKDPSLRVQRGVWLYRVVKDPSRGKDRELRAIEILFCPAKQSDFTACRVGVVWLAGHHPMGKSSDYGAETD
jgi:hypothetical protein